jgi:hypothetical protein
MNRIAVAALLCGVAGCASVQTAGSDAPAPAPNEDLYLHALQSIAEGRRNDASRELKRLIENEPKHAGAWIDLAMTQCALGHADEAERIFATIETRFQPNAEILRLIAEAREEGCNHWQASSNWLVAAGRGVDQNVNQGARTATWVIDAPGGQIEHELTADFRPQRDQYTVLSGEYTREVSPNGSIGFAQFLTRHNDRLHQYDTDSAFAGLETPWRFGRWAMRTTASAGLVTLGGKLYQRQAQLQARVTVPLPLPQGLQLNVVASGAYNDFLTLTNFNSNVWELRSQLAMRRGASYANASIGYLQDHALAQRPGGDRQGWFGNLLWRRQIAGPLVGELAYTHQTWNSKSAYLPGLIEQVRTQSTGVLRASVAYALSKHQTLQLEGRLVRNRENISIFEYNNSQLQLSWQWQGP